ncbi:MULTISPECIES: hypothetical protein [Oceanobacillus]|uniref:Uncharacterized protein n=1 Tax=Oceanobacillus kimchii TaxID=746691 RepID=A0ABQ5TP20_9BACI|nr:hypothetical protein [Oceanobacillus kimchii]GLO68255.1 hypothetical protein MACH08_40390 [Oceanobacillus kimchii]
MPTFNEKVMRNLVKKDRYLTFVFNDLLKRNENISEKNVLEVIFNSNIIEDSSLELIYITEFQNVNK